MSYFRLQFFARKGVFQHTRTVTELPVELFMFLFYHALWNIMIRTFCCQSCYYDTFRVKINVL